jgi:HlyD family secretion protein
MAPASSDIARVPSGSDPAVPILLEFESPTAALIAQPVPLRSRIMTWVLASMFLVALVLSGTIPIDRVVTAQGRVVATSNNMVVQPLEVSIVRSIDVREGQIVHAGDLLARLDPTFAAADADTYAAQTASLQAEVNRLRAEVEGKPYISDGTQASQLQALLYAQRHAERQFRLVNYAQKIEALQVKIDQARGDIAAYSERLGYAKSVEGMRQELERQGVGSKLNRFDAQDRRAEAERSLAGAKATLAGAQHDLQATSAERDSYIQQALTESSQQLTEQDRKLGDARESSNKAQLRRHLVELRADRDSIVLSVASVSVGSVMQSGDEFIKLVPIDAPLQVEVIIDARDAGFVRVGDHVVIKFETFPYVTYGAAEGTIRAISPDSFRNPIEDRTRPTRPRGDPQDFGNLYYRGKVSMDAVKLHDLPEGFRLQPGMPVTADVKVGKRTVLAYMMTRVIPATTQGMREP